MKSYKIAVIPGDGIGPEIVPAGVKVINFSAKEFGFQVKYVRIYNRALTDSEVQLLLQNP